MCPSVVQRIRLNDLRKAPVTGISTLYILPQDDRIGHRIRYAAL